MIWATDADPAAADDPDPADTAADPVLAAAAAADQTAADDEVAVVDEDEQAARQAGREEIFFFFFFFFCCCIVSTAITPSTYRVAVAREMPLSRASASGVARSRNHRRPSTASQKQVSARCPGCAAAAPLGPQQLRGELHQFPGTSSVARGPSRGAFRRS